MSATQQMSDFDLKNKVMQSYEKENLKKNDFPSEVINLPSKGWYYPEGHPLANGTVEMRYMTAKDEDILTSKNLIAKKVVLEKLIDSLIVTPGVSLKNIFSIDMFAMMVAARVLGYGKDYKVSIEDPDYKDQRQELTIDLTTLEEKEHVFLDENKNKNDFDFLLPKSNIIVKWKYLTYSEDLQPITSDSRGRKEKDVDSNSTDSLKKQIIEFNGETNPIKISELVNNMLALDSRALRVEIESNKPGINTKVIYTSNITLKEHEVELPLTSEFFWPSTRE